MGWNGKMEKYSLEKNYIGIIIRDNAWRRIKIK